jgi:hypothetical protein
MSVGIRHYRIFDLSLLTILAVLAELISQYATAHFMGSGFYLSFSILVAFIAMIRWGASGILVYVVAGLVNVFTRANSGFDLSFAQALLLYPVTHAGISLAALMFKKYTMEELVERSTRLLAFTLLGYLGIGLGKGIVGILLGYSFLNFFTNYLLINLFNLIIVFIVLLLLSRKGDLMLDMEKFIREKGSTAK